ncbi:MAG: DMT family transporter [Dehalococcoidia bacterium]
MSIAANPWRTRFAALPERRQGLLAVLLAAGMWSTGGLFIKWVSLDAMGVTMWRALFAGITMAVVSGAGFGVLRRSNRFEWSVALSYALTLLFFVLATKLTTAANAIFLQYTAPLHTLWLSRLLLDEQPRRIDLICLATAFGGMGLFFVGRLDAADTWGNLAALASGLAFGLFFTLLRRPECEEETRPRAMVLGSMLLAATGLAWNLGAGDGDVFVPSPGDMAGLLFLGVVQIGLAYVVFSFGIARVRALEAGLIGMLEPVLNPVWVFLALGEQPGMWAIAGGTIIVAAVLARAAISERGGHGTAEAVPVG